jgi:hypothetical protein
MIGIVWSTSVYGDRLAGFRIALFANAMIARICNTTNIE